MPEREAVRRSLPPLLLFCLAAPLAAQGFDAQHAAAVADTVPRIEKLASWCRGAGLLAERDELYEALLLFEPDHRRARSVLRYRRSKGKGWKRSPSYRKPHDPDSAFSRLPELIERRETELGPFRDRMLKLLAGKEDIAPAAREKVLLEIVGLHPMCKEAHAGLGEVLDLGEWVLTETARARKRRPQLHQWARECLEAVPEKAEEAEARPVEKRLGLAWVGAVRSNRLRVMSTVDMAEIMRVWRLLEAHWPFLEKALGARPFWVQDFTVMTLHGKDEAVKVFEGHPWASAQQRSLVRRVSGMWLNSHQKKQHLVEYPEDRARRIDGVLRQALGMSFKYHYGIGTDQAWVWEGLGLQMSWLLAGTRLTTFAKPGAYDREEHLGDELDKPDADWLFHAARLLDSERKPNLHAVLNRRVNDMTLPELLYGYALSVYLLEGRPADLVRLMTLIGREKLEPHVAVLQVLGTDLPGLERRLRRWLREMSS